VVSGPVVSNERQLLASGAEPTARSECGDASPLSTLNVEPRKKRNAAGCPTPNTSMKKASGAQSSLLNFFRTADYTDSADIVNRSKLSKRRFWGSPERNFVFFVIFCSESLSARILASDL